MNVRKMNRTRKILLILLVAVLLSVYVKLFWDFYKEVTAPPTGDPDMDKYLGLYIVFWIFSVVLAMPPCVISQLLILFGINRIWRNKLSGVPTNFCIGLSVCISVLIFAVYALQVFVRYNDYFLETIVPINYLYVFSPISLVLYIVGKRLTRRKNTEQGVSETNV